MPNWGITATLAISSTINYAKAIGGTSPATSGMTLLGVYIYLESHAAQCRLAVYQGGDLATGPDGATLIEDVGQTSGSDTGWVYVASSTNPALAASTPTWIGWKASSGPVNRASANSGDAGDFQSARGRFNAAAITLDEETAWPDPWPVDGGSFQDAWHSIYLVYSVAPSGYTVTAESGSFSVTGTAAGLEHDHRLGADAGSFTLTGTAAGLEYGRKLAAASGAYSVAGTAVSLEYGRRLGAAAGSYAVTGTAATLTYTPGTPGYPAHYFAKASHYNPGHRSRS